MIDKPLLILIK